MTYSLTANANIIIRDSDGAFIPTDAGNVDYQAYLTWVGLGNTATAVSGPTPAQQAHTALNAGLALTSTGTASLNATYAVDQSAQLTITATLSRINSGVLLPISVSYPDITNTLHTFPRAAFVNFAAAVNNYVNALNVIIASNSGALPVATATIA